VLAVVLAIGAARIATGPAPPPQPAAAGSVRTAQVVRTDLSDYRTIPGTLGYPKGRTLHGLGDRVVTWLPPSGRLVTRGEPLYRADDRPVTLFYGTTPLFRTLKTEGTVGRDVRVVARNLRALGYSIGRQPAAGSHITVPGPKVAFTVPADSSTPSPGTKAPAVTRAPSSPVASRQIPVREGDGVLTTSLIAAIKRWQSTVGLDSTGVLRAADVVVLTGKVRVGAVRVHLGDAVTEDLMMVTGTTKAVTVDVPATDVGGIDVGDKVRITLPDDSATPGTVTSISANTSAGPAEGSEDNSDSAEQRVAVTLAFDRPAEVRRLNAASVQVRFTAFTTPDVLAVPVGALLALSGGGYAVQIPAGALVAVKTGVFADGMVQISGTGIAAGMKVATIS
jgi:hypothetical protein